MKNTKTNSANKSSSNGNGKMKSQATEEKTPGMKASQLMKLFEEELKEHLLGREGLNKSDPEND